VVVEGGAAACEAPAEGAGGTSSTSLPIKLASQCRSKVNVHILVPFFLLIVVARKGRVFQDYGCYALNLQ
jgi:hypothetical protein